MRKKKAISIILIFTILFSPFITTMDATVVEASIASDYAAAEKEGKKLISTYSSFSKTITSGNLDTINQQFYTFSNSVKATEIKINKVNSKSKREKLKTAYLTPALKLRDTVIHPISEYRSLNSIKNLLIETKEEQAVKEFKKLDALKKNSAKIANGLNKNAIAELNTLDKDIGKQIAKIVRKNTAFEKPSNFIDINKPRVKLDKYYFTMVPDSKVTREELAKYTEYAEIANEGILGELGYLGDIQGMLEGLDLKIHVQDTPDKYANVGLWNFVTTGNGKGEIYLLTESAHKVKCCTSTGSNFNDAYFKDTMMHEMTHSVMYAILINKSMGWKSMYSSPAWFKEGYSEYMAVKYAANTNKLRLMIDRVIDENSIQFTDKEIKVNSVYVDGLVLMQFLHEKYSTETIHKVLMSPEPTFEKALEKEIGNMNKIKVDFQDWISKK
ncbi:hypothetical protein MKZ20_03875 [Psychrobacillus sp. FSL K6-2684]|uniref:hypothetical protein n=1 Tax=unclassified Psychrobacillus TaxID=2636677 RepID=UPI0030F5C9F7